ncbi:hypothetical protein HYH03_007148 [Edaphochlamys debaryana]|uniref:Uncharacterized protein n=1 Tax=Edaphochlamys debaryana TaxID=47281 RepID=A0A835YBS3_9CHLO|nr:hypothetical protein HYH03_007148 [Edaphochlamys debaryana]|eukprot:KAG2494629.1 hypothetical protein HYH03_007148 [Edaphochlamys debaryana]
MPPRAAAARRAGPTAEERARENALRALRDSGNQALALARDQPCVLSASQVDELVEAVRHFAALPQSCAWTAVGDAGLAGTAALFALALRRSAPGAEGVTESLRAAYASLRFALSEALAAVQCDGGASGGTAPQLPLPTARLLCTALLNGGLCSSYASLLSASSSALLAQKPNPPRRSLQTVKDLLLEVWLVVIWVQRVKACHNQAPAKDPGLEAAASTAVFDSAVVSIFTSSLLFEHWARLVLALACCEGTEEVTASGAERLAFAISSLEPLLGFKAWSPPVDPGLPFLLASHLVTLAAVLDGGPTFGLPPGPAGGAGPSGAQPGPALPLADTRGGVLRTGPGRGPTSEVASITHARTSIKTWGSMLERVLEMLREAERSPHLDTLPEPFRPPPLGPPPLYSATECARGACARAVEHAAARMTAALVYEAAEPGRGEYAVSSCREDLAACTRMKAAVDRGDVLYDWAAAFEVGMRLAGGAAVQLCGQGPGAGAGAAAFGPHTEAALRQLHAPAAWRGGPGLGAEPSQPPAPTRPPARRQAAPLLEARKTVSLCVLGLGLAHKALAVPIEVYDSWWGWQGPPPPWLRRRLAAWWRAALTWAQEGLTEGWGDLLWLLHLPSLQHSHGLPAEPSPDLAAALSAGYLPAVERLLRSPSFDPEKYGPSTGFPAAPGQLSVWSEVLAFSDPAQALSFVASASKRIWCAVRAMSAAAATYCRGAEEAQAKAVLSLVSSFANAFTPGVGLPSALVAYPGAAPLPEGWPVVMSSVAARLLMPASTTLLRVAPLLLPGLPGNEKAQPVASKLVQLTALLLAWVPSLVAAASPPLEAESVPAAEGGAEGAGGLVGTEADPAGSGRVGAAAARPGLGLDPMAHTEEAGPLGSGASARARPDLEAHPIRGSCEAWRLALWMRLQVGDLMGIALELEQKLAGDEVLVRPLRQALLPALWALAFRGTADLAKIVVKLGAQPETSEGAPPPPRPTRDALRRLLGPGGRAPEPALLAAVERVCEEAARAKQADTGAGASGSAAAGSSGSSGAAGPSGSSAAAGPSGSSAAAGPSGSSAAAGPSGSSSAAGPSGSSAAAGPSGSSAAAGPSGAAAAAGPLAAAAGPSGSSAAAGPSGSSAAADGAGDSAALSDTTLAEEVRRYAAAPSLLLDFDQVFRLQPGCANVWCDFLAGPSEAGLPLLVELCDAYGPVRFCSRACCSRACKDTYFNWL